MMNLEAMGVFSHRFKTPLSLFQLVIVIVVLSLSVARIFLRPAGAPRSRASTMSLGMSAKSLVILSYELLTEHVPAFKRWGSLKAYLILNGMEIVFWGAVVYLIISSSIAFCVGVHCALGWVVMALGIILCLAAVYMTIICWIDWRYYTDTDGNHRPPVYIPDEESKGKPESDRNSGSADAYLMHTRNSATRQAVPRQQPPQRQGDAWEDSQPKSPSYVQNSGVEENRPRSSRPASRSRHSSQTRQQHQQQHHHHHDQRQRHHSRQRSSDSRRPPSTDRQARSHRNVRESYVTRHEQLQKIRGENPFGDAAELPTEPQIPQQPSGPRPYPDNPPPAYYSRQ